MRTSSRFLPALSLALLGALTSGAPAAVVVIPCDRDNTLFEDADGDTSSGAGTSLYSGTNSQPRARRALVRFALEGIVAVGARVDSAVLTLHVASAPDTVARTFALHKVTRDWGEGTSAAGGGSGAPATAGDATWVFAFFPGTPWITPGGDFEAGPSATRDVGEAGPWSWSGDGLVADVASWLADPPSNAGWILLCGDEAISRSVRRFDAREAADPALRPSLRLVLEETVPALPVSWGRLKSNYRGGVR